MTTTDIGTSLTRNVAGREMPLPGKYELDRAHTTIEFVGRHLMITKVRGRFNDFDGVIVVGDTPQQSTVHVTIGTASIATSDEKRDAHLRSGDFFDVEAFPTIEFVSTSVEPGKGDSWIVYGDLTVRGVSKPVTLEMEFDGAETNPWGEYRAGFSATTEVDRELWGLTWNVALETGGVLVSKKIKLELNVQAVRRDG